jgi:prolyl oligopeptidase
LADQLIVENKQERDRWFVPSVSEDGKQLVITSAQGKSPIVDIFLKRLAGNTSELENLNSGKLGQFYFLGNKGPQFYFLTDWTAPHQKIVSVRIDLPRERAWETVVAEDNEMITHASLVADRFIIQYSKDAAPVFKIFALNGDFAREIKMPTLGNVWGYPWGPGFTGSRTDPVTFFSLTGMADPGSIYCLNPQSGELSLWKRPELRFDPDQFVTEHGVYRSKDGTNVPIFLVHKKGLERNGENPTWLYAYGALAWSSFPWFQPHMVAWVENGGVFALAGIRGGGEYGEAWHQAGIKTNRERAIEDYISAAEWLIHSNYTSHKKLVANGGSLSGSLPAVALVRRPDLFASIVIDFPVLDMVRYSQHTGALMWLSELGSVDNIAEFHELLNYSPYHNLKQGECYPPTIIEAGTHDETAVPSHAYKFTAALQAAQGCRENPILLLAVEGAGHGFGATPEQAADTTAFEIAFVTKALSAPATFKTEAAKVPASSPKNASPRK